MFEPDGLLQSLDRLGCNEGIVLAFSGGLDSSVLLDALTRLRDAGYLSAFRAIHVNHGLSDEAESWAQHCAQQCDARSVKLEVLSVEVRRGGQGLEAAARKARYAAFERNLFAGEHLLTAQHMDDQAETVLLRLLRGAGPGGLGGMRSRRTLGSAYLVRPLLGWGRSELYAYAKSVGLAWIEDHSNSDLALDRNYLRHKVMPVLAERWPAYAASFSRSADLIEETDRVLVRHARNLLLETGAEQGILPISMLQQTYPESMRAILLREWVRLLGLAVPGSQPVRRILNEVLVAGEDRAPRVEWGAPCERVELRRYRDRLYVGPLGPDPEVSEPLEWSGTPAVALPDGSSLLACPAVGAGVDERHLQSGIEIRFRQGGERCQPVGRCGSHPLKKIFQERGVPPWLRGRIPLIFSGETLIAVAGQFVCEGYSASEKRPGVEFIWEPGPIEGAGPIC